MQYIWTKALEGQGGAVLGVSRLIGYPNVNYLRLPWAIFLFLNSNFEHAVDLCLMLNYVHKWKVVLVNCSSFQLDWPLEICLISWIHVCEKSLIFCCKILWFIFWCWNSWIIKSWETTFRIALNFANLPWFYSTYLIEKKTFPQFHFQRNHTVLPSPETSFLANFTNNWSFSIEIDFCAKYWRNPISAFTISAFCIGGEFCWYCWNSKFEAWQPKLFKLIFVQNIGTKLLLALKIFAEMCLNWVSLWTLLHGNPSLKHPVLH